MEKLMTIDSSGKKLFHQILTFQLLWNSLAGKTMELTGSVSVISVPIQNIFPVTSSIHWNKNIRTQFSDYNEVDKKKKLEHKHNSLI